MAYHKVGEHRHVPTRFGSALIGSTRLTNGRHDVTGCRKLDVAPLFLAQTDRFWDVWYSRNLITTMRTSRISRDTSRIVAASRTQRTLRQTRSTANIPSHDAQYQTAMSTGNSTAENSYSPSESDLSSPPPEVDSNEEESQSSKKRKRQPQTPTPVKIKNETNEISIAVIDSPLKGSKPKRARRTPAKKVKQVDGSVKMEPPSSWEEIYALTREMRNKNIAPVDTMGCESLADRQRSPRDQRFQTLIALMLSSQTKDTVTAVAMRGMQERMPGVC